MREEFKEYVERMKEIRLLSTLALENVTSEEDYGKILIDHFRQIGAMAAENRKTVENILLPILQSERPLSNEEKQELSELNELLVDYQNGAEIDQHVSEMINERLTNEMEDMEVDRKDTENYLRSIVKTMQIKYFRMITSQHSNPENSEKCRAEGLEAFETLKKYLDKQTFSELSEQMREFVFGNCLNGALLYQAYLGGKRAFYRKKMMEELKATLDRIHDDDYKAMMPSVKWHVMELRVYDHMSAMLLDPELPQEEAREIYPFMLKMKEVCQATEETMVSMDDMTATLFQAAAMAGDPSVLEHFEEMLKLREKRDEKDFSRHGGQMNQSYPLIIYECLAKGKVRGDHLKEQDYVLLDEIVRDMLDYAGEMPKNIMLADRIIMHNKLMNVFLELPGKLKFSELCMKSMAAIHPPTYVHSQMVARIAACLTRHLLEKRPETFVGFSGVSELKHVRDKKEEILEYAYGAALYHDVGKLTILDTIGMYGRNLLDSEFYNVKRHPDNGHQMAIKHKSTKEYADVIRGHHRYYDNSAGYPEEFDTSKSPYKAIIDVVTLADCMDAATDGVGRSYNVGKTLEDFLAEVREGAGTRYAPYFPELLDREDVREDIEYLLTKERNEIYNKIYELLKNL